MPKPTPHAFFDGGPKAACGKCANPSLQGPITCRGCLRAVERLATARQVGDVIELDLIRGMVALIDAADRPLARWKWTAHEVRAGQFYACRIEWICEGKNRRYYLHREVLGAPPRMMVDHVNGNPLDCRRSNLRIATHAENLRNRGKSRRNTSGYKGVSFSRKYRSTPWRAGTTLNGKSIVIGMFATPEEAAHAYDRFALEHHGEFAHLNFPDDAGRARRLLGIEEGGR